MVDCLEGLVEGMVEVVAEITVEAAVALDAVVVVVAKFFLAFCVLRPPVPAPSQVRAA